MSFIPAIATMNVLAQAAAPAAAGPSDILMNFLPIIAVMVVFYFLLIRPQQQRLKQHQKILSELKKGDTVVTSGGFIGKVKALGDVDVSVEIAPNVVVKVVRATISEVRNETPANDVK